MAIKGILTNDLYVLPDRRLLELFILFEDVCFEGCDLVGDAVQFHCDSDCPILSKRKLPLHDILIVKATALIPRCILYINLIIINRGYFIKTYYDFTPLLGNYTQIKHFHMSILYTSHFVLTIVI